MHARLHPHENLVLAELKNMKKAAINELSKKTGLPEDAVHKAVHWLVLKGLARTEEKTRTKAKLTSEGETYLKEGLPEKNLLKLISQGKTSLNELKKTKNSGIAIGWAKRKGWITIRNGKAELTPEGDSALRDKTPAEKTLLGESDAALEELRKRGLVNIEETTKKICIITKQGLSFRTEKPKKEIGQLTPEIIKSGKWKETPFRPYSLNTPVPQAPMGKRHPYSRFIDDVRQKLIALGFTEVSGPYVETEFWNSDALFMPHDHPARGIHDVFMIKTRRKGVVKNRLILEKIAKTHKNGWITGSRGWGEWNPERTRNLILRSQTTAVSARTLASNPEIPGKYFVISRNFRPDEIDATHFVEFHQVEGIVLGEGLTFRHLLGYLDMFGKEIAGADKIRFRPSYFPFTEPSVELDCYINGEWIELGGAGIFRPEVTLPLGVNVPVLAWGLGFERLAMIKLGADKIKTLYNDDLDWLRKRKAVI